MDCAYFSTKLKDAEHQAAWAAAIVDEAIQRWHRFEFAYYCSQWRGPCKIVQPPAITLASLACQNPSKFEARLTTLPFVVGDERAEMARSQKPWGFDIHMVDASLRLADGLLQVCGGGVRVNTVLPSDCCTFQGRMVPLRFRKVCFDPSQGALCFR
jgi:hypothetical protein